MTNYEFYEKTNLKKGFCNFEQDSLTDCLDKIIFLISDSILGFLFKYFSLKVYETILSTLYLSSCSNQISTHNKMETLHYYTLIVLLTKSFVILPEIIMVYQL